MSVVLAAKGRAPETLSPDAADAGSITDVSEVPAESVEKPSPEPTPQAQSAPAEAPESPETAPADGAEPKRKDEKKPAPPPAAQAKQPNPPAKVEKAKPAQAVLPRMLELGADKCIPCKMMKPIIEELQREYKGRLQMDFIDVWKEPGAAEKFGINTIPTQIFYDTDGKEFFRHVGFFSKEEILATFEEHGIKL